MTNDTTAENTLLKVENLRIAFRMGKRLSVPVRNVSFSIGREERVAIVGESGCGKSLTSLAVGGLVERADISGRVEFPATGAKRPAISYIFQNPIQSLDPVMRVGAQIREGAAGDADAAELLESVSLPASVAKKYPCELSGGQCQRVMIAAALAAKPSLLVADEPTTALDVTTQKEVLDLIDRISRERHMAVLLITHNLGLVAKYSDYVNVMYAGEIVEHGRVEDVIAHPRHPYTKGLIAAVPRLDARKDAPIASIPGVVPSPWAWPEGCAFHPRCPVARKSCGESGSFKGCPEMV